MSKSNRFCKPPDRVGYCAPTYGNKLGDCRAGNSGWLRIGTHSIQTFEDCARWCATSCERCNFVSYSEHPDRRSCEWHHSCELNEDRLRWAYIGTSFCTRQVQLALMPPPPPPPPPLPAGAALGYCALMGADTGDCDHDDQGSWPDVETFAGCVERCRGCAGCRFVSALVGSNGSMLASVLPAEGRRRRHKVKNRRRHAPHWSACRWYRHCDMSDLRQTPPTREEQYVSLKVKSGESREMAHALRPSQRPSQPQPTVRLALATLAMRKLDWRRTGGYDISCAMMQWCQNARRLQRALPSSWVTEVLVMDSGSETTPRAAQMLGLQPLRPLRPLRPL